MFQKLLSNNQFVGYLYFMFTITAVSWFKKSFQQDSNVYIIPSAIQYVKHGTLNSLEISKVGATVAFLNDKFY